MHRFLWLALFAAMLMPAAYGQEQAAKTVEQTSEAQEDSLLLWKWINFGLLAAGLGFAIVKTAPSFFNARSAEIQKAIKDATGLKINADFRASEIDRKMATLATEIQSLREASKAEMQQENLRIERETAASMEKVRANTAREIESLQHQAEARLKLRAIRMAVTIASARLREELTPQDRDELIHHFAQTVVRGEP